MTPRPLSYFAIRQPPAWAPKSHRRWVIALLLVTFIAVALPASFLVETGQSVTLIDPVTGSMQRQTWFLGLSSGPAVTPSPLEIRLRKMGVPRQPSWQFLHERTYTIWGMTLTRGCGLTPPILSFNAVSPTYASTATDDEVKAFLQVMQSGTQAQQRAAVEAASEKVFGAITANP